MTMRSRSRAILTLTLSAAAALAVLAPAARADVTVGQKTSMSLGAIKIDIDSVERTSADRQRSDSTVSCRGFFSLFCRGMEGGRIVRLDKRVEWELQPKKRIYSESPFPTPEQRAEAQKKVEAAMEEMKGCPVAQSPGGSQPGGPDTSRCQLSSPVLNVSRTGEHATILGHDARRTDVVMSQTCTDKQTGDVCEIDYGLETWLTADTIPGVEERNAFERKYLAAQGLDPNDPGLQHAVGQFMAPYADMLRQLRGRSADLQGYPLRTTFYMAFGGPHCARARQASQQQASRSSRFSMHGLAAHAMAGGLSGLFHHRAAAMQTESPGGAAAAAPAPGALIRVVSLTTETTSIDTSSISPDEFEIPAGWKLEPRQPLASSGPKCPAGK